MDERQGNRLAPMAELFELLVQSSTDFAIFTIDPKGTTTSWNIGAERLFGFSEEEMLGSTADVIFTPEDRAAGAPVAERERASSDGRAEDERWHLRKDGSRLWASGLLMPLKERSAGFFKIVRDQTERHRANELLRENEARFRLLATSIPQLVFRTRHDGTRTWGSPQWIDFTGLSLDESLGFGWLDAIHPEDRAATREAWDDAIGRGEYHCEHRVRRKRDGAYRWHQTRARPLDEQDPTASDWVGTMTDVHELRGLKDRQQVIMAELQHRTRNLLAVVQSIAAQTIRKSTSLEAFEREFGDRLRALGRVQGLLSRADQREIDLHALVAAELAAHGYQDGSDGTFTVGGPAVALPATAAQAFALAVHELATNALKHGALRRPGGRLSATWTVKNSDNEDRVEFEWRETGVAIPEGARPARQGYGSELIERALPYQLGAATELRFDPGGVVCRIAVPIEREKTGTRNERSK